MPKQEDARRISWRGFTQSYRQLMVATLINAPILILIFLLNIRYVEMTTLSVVYFVSVVVGYYLLPLLLVNVIIAMFLHPWPRAGLLLAGGVSFFYVFFMLMDSLAFTVARFHLDLFWMEAIVNDLSGFGLPWTTFVVVLLAAILVALVQRGVFAAANRAGRWRFTGLAVTAVILVAFGFSQVAHIVAYDKNVSRVTKLTPYLPFYIPFTSHSNADAYGDFLAIAKTESLLDSKAGELGSLTYPLMPMRFRPNAEQSPPNIVIVLYESWRADAISAEITPHAWALAQRGTLFRNHFSTGNQTTCGVFGLFYGLHASYWKAVKANNLHIDNPVLIDVMREHDYEFGIFAKSNFERHKIKDAIFNGIEVHESFTGATIREEDLDMTNQVVSFIESAGNRPQPFMALAFFKSNHMPYRYTAGHRIFEPAGNMNFAFVGPDSDPTEYYNDYLNSTHFVDSLVGEIIQAVEETGEMDNTIIILTTDHGESFNDNRMNYWGHGSNYTRYQVQVPLVMYVPGRQAQEISYRTSHMDVAPTLLQDAFGCTTPISAYANGRHLFVEPAGPRPLVIGSYVNQAYLLDDNVYEVYPIFTKKYRLDDVRVEADSPDPGLLRVTIEEISRFFTHEVASPEREMPLADVRR